MLNGPALRTLLVGWQGGARSLALASGRGEWAHDGTTALRPGEREGEAPGTFSQSPWQYARGEKQRGSLLARYGVDLSVEAKEGRLDPVVGRERVIERALQVLLRRTKNNPLLVGEPGVGKTAVAEGIAALLASDRAPGSLRGLRVVSLDLGSLVAGTHLRGAFEERLQGVLREVEAANGQVVLFIDEFHLLVSAGASQGSMDAANLLKPALARGKLRCIGATTHAEYRRLVEPDAALARRMQPVLVPPPSLATSMLCLTALLPRYQAHHGVVFEEAAVAAAVLGASRYIHDRRLPDSAVDLADEAASRVKLRDERDHAKLAASSHAPPSRVRPPVSRGAEYAPPGLGGGRTREEVTALLKWFGSVPTDNIKSGVEGHRQTTAARRRAFKEIWGEGKYEYPSSATEPSRIAAEGGYAVAPAGGMVMGLQDGAGGTGGGRRDPREQPPPPPPPARPVPVVREADILAVLAEWTGVPVTAVASDEQQRLLDLELSLGRAVVGQEAAVLAVSNALRMGRLGLRASGAASLLFLGGAGLGKTAVCRAVAEAMFGDPGAMTRLDMSEYSERSSVTRLLGAPPGYIGYQEGGILTNAVRQKPYSLVVFDELEKAHKEVISLLLQVLEEGQLTDSHGQVADFSQCVVILTSNLGGAAGITTRAEAEADAAKHLAPELLNRLDDICFFAPLSLGSMASIVDLQVGGAQGLVRERGVRLVMTEEARGLLAAAGHAAGEGARPLRRLIRREVLAPLASALLAGSIPPPSTPGSLRAVEVRGPPGAAGGGGGRRGAAEFLGLRLVPAGEVEDGDDDQLRAQGAGERVEEGQGQGGGWDAPGEEPMGVHLSGQGAYERHIANSHAWGPGGGEAGGGGGGGGDGGGAGAGAGGEPEVLWGGPRERARLAALKKLRERASIP